MPYTEKQIDKWKAQERKEHPWADERTITRIVTDHHPSLKKRK
jgi:hypothetical protein